jgi:multidrug resistance efflux pump
MTSEPEQPLPRRFDFIRTLSPRAVAILGLVALLLYAAWIGWPYLESIVVRDAAVTSWLSFVASPISGYSVDPLYPGTRTGPNGRIATVSDARADRRPLAVAEADAMRAAAAVASQSALVTGMRRALAEREAHSRGFSSLFSGDLDASIGAAVSANKSLATRLALARTDEDRIAALYASGHTSRVALDMARAEVARLESEKSASDAALARARTRHRGSSTGVFLLEDGTDGNSVFQNLSDARLRLVQAEGELARLRAEETATRGVLLATTDSYEKSRSLDVRVKPGAMVWSLLAGPGDPLQPGTPIASWVDCELLLVDVPISDIESSLLKIGAVADVVFEGEHKTRHGRVILTRGSSGILGSHDLAALAKGRRPGIGQAIVKLDADADDLRDCPIGHAAHVDFPSIGVFNLLRARLRL